MTRATNYPRLSIYEEDSLVVANVVNNILDGKINSTGSVTLANSATTTTLSDDRIGM